MTTCEAYTTSPTKPSAAGTSGSQRSLTQCTVLALVRTETGGGCSTLSAIYQRPCLFGTATDADVQEVKNQLRAFGATNRKVVHYVSKLITVVNHTHVQLSENRRHIVTLHKFFNQLSRAIRVTVTAMNSTKQRLTILETKLRIEQILRSLEASHEYWLRQVMTFNRQKAALELGFLTEDLVSRQDLMHIVKSGLQAGFYAPAINWFYSNIRVSPIAWTGHQLIFRVKLPLTDKVLYKRYSVWSWPIYRVIQLNIMSKFRSHLTLPFTRSRVAYFNQHFAKGNTP